MAALDRICWALVVGKLMPGSPAAADEIDQVLILAGGLRVGSGVDLPQFDAAALQCERIVDGARFFEEVIQATDSQYFGKAAAIEFNAEVARSIRPSALRLDLGRSHLSADRPKANATALAQQPKNPAQAAAFMILTV